MTVLMEWAVIYFVINFFFSAVLAENKYSRKVLYEECLCSLDPGGLSDIVRGSTENR